MRLPAVRKRAEIIRLFHVPACASGKFLQMHSCDGDGSPRFLLVVSSRYAKAVLRNRIRRIIREWCRIHYKRFSEGRIWMIKATKFAADLPKGKLSSALRNELEQLLPQCEGFDKKHAND